jgi:hypothetical protein
MHLLRAELSKGHASWYWADLKVGPYNNVCPTTTSVGADV